MPLASRLSPVLAGLLHQGRPAFNARFAAARLRWPHLDAADFSLFLRDQLSPLLDAVAAIENVPPAHPAGVAQVGYELGLQLVAEKLAGPGASHPALNALWSHGFPALAPLVANAPRRVLGSLCNAAHQLATTPGADPARWREALTTLGPACVDTAQLLALGALLAWRAGLAHYRVSALHAASALPSAVALAAVGAPADASWPDVRETLLRDPWRTFPAGVRPPTATRAPVRRVGAFRGFGGHFTAPPLVCVSGEHLLVRSGDDAWLLIADACGATFHRASTADLDHAAAPSVSASLGAYLPAGYAPASVAVLGPTFAVTSAQSHAVWIGPPPSRPR